MSKLTPYYTGALNFFLTREACLTKIENEPPYLFS